MACTRSSECHQRSYPSPPGHRTRHTRWGHTSPSQWGHCRWSGGLWQSDPDCRDHTALKMYEIVKVQKTKSFYHLLFVSSNRLGSFSPLTWDQKAPRASCNVSPLLCSHPRSGSRDRIESFLETGRDPPSARAGATWRWRPASCKPSDHRERRVCRDPRQKL